MNHHKRPQLKNVKSVFQMNVANQNAITDDRVREYLRTEILVKEWIETVLQIKISENLYESLKNGVALCYLINTIREGIVPTIFDKPGSKEFHYRPNVEYLIMALDDLNIPKYKLFLINDLYEGENMVRVVMCLVELSKLSKIQIKPMNNQIPVQLPTGDSLVYLKSLLSQIRDPSKASKGQKKMGTNIVKAQISLLAGPAFTKCELGVLRFQSIWRGYKERKIYKKLKRDIAHRERVVKEIIKTETDYVDSLKRCIEGYMDPLSKVLTKEQVKNIFSDIKIIRDFGIKILALLNEKVRDWKTYQKVGDAFILIAEVLKVYTSYVQNFNVALETLEEVKKNKQTLQLITDCRDNPITKNFDLSAFLIMPIQRVPRYSMLLTDLVKHTAKDHPDYESLVKSEEKMKSITSYLNEKKREGENLVKFSEIQGILVGKVPQLCTPSRRFIREGVFSSAIKKKSDIMIYLFNDVIVYGKPQKNLISNNTANKRVKYISMISLTNIRAVDDPKNPLSFHIQSLDTDKTNLLSLSSKVDQQEKSDWINEIQQLIKLLASNMKSIELKLKGATIEDINQSTTTTVEQTKSVEEQLAEKKKKTTTSTNSSSTTTPPSSPPPTSVSLPNSPTQVGQQLDQPSGGLQTSFISSLFGRKSTSSSKTGTLTSPPTTPNKESNSNSATDNSPPLTGLTAETTTTPSSDKSAEKNNRPGKKTKSRSKDDSDIGKSSTGEESNRSRASTQSRLSKIAGALTMRRKKNIPIDSDSENASSNEASPTITSTTPTIKVEEATGSDLTQSLPSSLQSNNTTTTNTNQTGVNNLKTIFNHVSPNHSPSSSLNSSPTVPRKNYRISVDKRNSGSIDSLTEQQNLSDSPQITILEPSLSFDEIQKQKQSLDLYKLECYLSNDEFKQIFSVDRDQFYKYPKWRQDKLKTEKKLL